MTRSTNPRKWSLCATALALMALNTGCANWMRSGVTMAAQSTYQPQNVNYTSVTGNGGFPSDTDHTCPTNANTQTTGGADPYTICVGNTNPFNLSLHGSPSPGKSQVCIFPVDVVSGTQAYAASDSQGQILDQCVDMSSGYETVTFTGARFNGAFVVPAQYESDMAWCLENGNYEACPAYSYQRWGEYDTGSPGNTQAGH